MGRGKTLAIAVAAATIAYRRSAKKAKKDVQVVVLLPSVHMVNQVERDMLLLDPSFQHPDYPTLPTEQRDRLLTTLLPEEPVQPRTEEEDELVQDDVRDGTEEEVEFEFEEVIPDVKKKTTVSKQSKKELRRLRGTLAPVLLATAKDLVKVLNEPKPWINISSVGTLIIDEPDSMLPALPSRRISTGALAKHPLYRHPPPLVQVLDTLLDIRYGKRGPLGPGAKLDIDLRHRRPVQTVWTSGTLDGALKRLAYVRSWVRSREAVVDLDYTPSATERQQWEREQATLVKGQKGLVTTEPISMISGVKPEHFVLSVDEETGAIDTLDPNGVNMTPNFPVNPNGSVSPTIVEAVALVHSLSPPPRGTYALAVPPEGVSLDGLSSELSGLGVPSLTLRPETIHDVSLLETSPTEDNDAPAPVLVGRRSAVPGLHLPKLHTIYLLGGLDLYGGGRKADAASRVNFYEVLAGRVGRLGTDNTMMHKRQRVISLVLQGSGEEKALADLFSGRLGASDISQVQGPGRPEGQGGGLVEGGQASPSLRRFQRREWDVRGMRDAMRDAL